MNIATEPFRTRCARQTARWLCAWLLCGWFGVAAATSTSGADHSWQLSAHRSSDGTDGIDIYLRPVPNSPYDEARVVTSVCAPIDALAVVLTDVSHFDEWIPDTKRAQQLAAPSEFERIYYIRTGLPWPIKDRDMVYRVAASADPHTANALTVTLQGLPDYLPHVDGVVRMISVQGRWQLARVGDRTHIELVMRIEPGGGIPTWLAQRRIVATPTKMVQNIGRLFATSCPNH
jgi:START domain